MTTTTDTPAKSGPNIFRVLEKIGLKDAVLADAHVPKAQ